MVSEAGESLHWLEILVCSNIEELVFDRLKFLANYDKIVRKLM